MRRAALLCLAPFLLWACASEVSVTRPRAVAPSLDSHLRLLEGVGEVHALVVGSPFADDPDDAGLRAAMANQLAFPRLRYVPSRAAGDRYDHRVIIAFEGRPLRGAEHCRAPPRPSSPAPPDVTEIHAVLCAGPTALSEAAARTRRIDRANDPRLRRAMGDLLLALFKPPQRTDSND